MDMVRKSASVRTRYTPCQYRPHAACAPKKTRLEDDGALKDDEHEQREQAEVPVLVEAPQRDAEDLEHEEGRGGVLREERGEGRDGDVALVLAVQGQHVLELWSPGGGRKLPSGGLGRGGVGQAQERGWRRGGVADVGVALVAEPVRGLGDGRQAAPQRQGRDGSRSS